MKRALVTGKTSAIVSDGRTGMNSWFAHNHDDITKSIGIKIANLVKLPLENAESFQIIYYDKSQEYRSHYDGWEHNQSESSLRNMEPGGQRVYTALAYLNNVKSGGGTKFTRLNKIINAERGKLLVFKNTINDNHTRHELSEHAGLPVIEGEKFAFNLWFREKSRLRPYKSFNPEYFKTDNNKLDLDKCIIKSKFTRLHTTKTLLEYSNNLRNSDITTILNNCVFTNSKMSRCWVNFSDVMQIAKKLTALTGISYLYYDNINVIKYFPGEVQEEHFDAFDINNTPYKEDLMTQGQRLFTITIFLSDNIKVIYPNIKFSKTLNKGNIVIIKNTEADGVNRDEKMMRKNINEGKSVAYLGNIYIRAKNKNGQNISN